MDDDAHLDFLSALGEEFSEALRPVTGRDGVVPQDGYELFLRVFEQEPTPRLLAALTDAELERLRAGCEAYVERPGVTFGHVRELVSRTLARWPADAD